MDCQVQFVEAAVNPIFGGLFVLGVWAGQANAVCCGSGFPGMACRIKNPRQKPGFFQQPESIRGDGLRFIFSVENPP